jgi:hypothetical protein
VAQSLERGPHSNIINYDKTNLGDDPEKKLAIFKNRIPIHLYGISPKGP